MSSTTTTIDMFLSFIFGMFIGDKDSESRAQRQIEKRSFLYLAMPRRILSKIKSKIVKAGRRDFSKNKVFQDLALPRRILSYQKIAKAEAVVNKECSFSYLALLRTFGLRLRKERSRAQWKIRKFCFL